MSTIAEFINLISSELNHVCSRKEKRTIAPEHVLKALEVLGFGDCIEEVYAAYEQHKLETVWASISANFFTRMHLQPWQRAHTIDVSNDRCFAVKKFILNVRIHQLMSQHQKIQHLLHLLLLKGFDIVQLQSQSSSHDFYRVGALLRVDQIA